jgi:hypothetical protein
MCQFPQFMHRYGAGRPVILDDLLILLIAAIADVRLRKFSFQSHGHCFSSI